MKRLDGSMSLGKSLDSSTRNVGVNHSLNGIIMIIFVSFKVISPK
jgi:hypothetical protein